MGLGELAHVVLALLFVLVLVVLLSRLARRARGLGGRGREVLEVLADVPLAQKERAVLLRVGTTQVLLGVAPGQVTALHVLPVPIANAVAAEAPAVPSFQALLKRSLGL